MGNNYSGTSFQIANSLAKVMALRTMMQGRELSKDEIYTLKGMKVVNDFLNAPINSVEEDKLKKAFVAAVITSSELGHVNLGENYTTEQITIAISQGLTKIKTQYLVGQGTFTESKAEEIELDYVIACLAQLIEKGIDEWCKQLPEKLDELAEEYYDEMVPILTNIIKGGIAIILDPEAADYISIYINEFLYGLKDEVRKYIKMGAQYVIDYVRPQIEQLVQDGIIVIQKTYNWVKDFLNIKPSTPITTGRPQESETEEENQYN